MIFIPLITKYLQEHPNAPRDLVAEIQPYFNKVELYPYRAKHKKHFHIIKPFVDENKLQEMRTHALKFVPDNYNIETYNRKVYDAIKTVDHELNKIRKLTKMEQKKVTKLNPIINLHKDENIYQGHFSTKK